MMRSRTKQIAGSISYCLVTLALAAGVYGVKAEGQQSATEQQTAKETKSSIPAEQVIASIRTAITVKPGDVLAVEAEVEDGKTLCAVEILAQDRKTYEVEVDVATNTVVEVEADDDDEEKDDRD